MASRLCAGVIVHNSKNEVLVVLGRSYGKTCGKFGFPKGHVEGNETDAQCAFRELSEEARVEIKAVYTKIKRIGKQRWFFAKSDTHFPVISTPREIVSAEWVHFTKLSNLNLNHSAKEILSVIEKALRSPESGFGELYTSHFALPVPLIPPSTPSPLPLPPIDDSLPPVFLPTPLPVPSSLPSPQALTFEDLFPSLLQSTLETPQQMICSPLIPFPF